MAQHILWEIVSHHYLRHKTMISDARTMMFFLIFHPWRISCMSEEASVGCHQLHVLHEAAAHCVWPTQLA